MALVVTYWQLPEDELDFFSYLANRQDVAAVVLESSDKPFTPKIYPGSDLAVNKSIHKKRLLFIPSHITQTIHPTYHTNPHFPGTQDGYSFDLMKDLVIAYTPPQYSSEGFLHQSNLSAYSDWLNDADPKNRYTENKSPEFIKWAKSIMNWVRKQTPKQCMLNEHNYRATSAVKKQVDEGRLKLAL